MSTNLSSNLDVLFGKMEGFISTKTVVGEPTNIGGVIVVPLVDVSFAVGAGVNEGKDEKGKDMGIGTLGGKITPVAVLVIVDGTVQLVSVKNQDNIKKLIDMVPGILSKFNLGSVFSKKKDKKEDNNEGQKVVFEETRVSEINLEPEPQEFNN